MIAPLLLMLAAPAADPPVDGLEARYNHCVDLAAADPAQGLTEADQWRRAGGGFLARQCAGIALAAQKRWAAAAGEFRQAAQDAEVAHDERAAFYWAQAGNALLAGGDAKGARGALDAALAAGTLKGLQRGEATFDRARAMVALGELPAARADIDSALKFASADPLLWLASASLARRMGDLSRARADAEQAYNRAPDDAEVYIEIGNIAAAGGDAAGAKAAWTDAVRVGGDSDAGRRAKAALAQFDATIHR